MDKHRIKVKIGEAEFDAEGPQDIITKQFEAFMAAVAVMPKNAAGSQGSAITTQTPKPLESTGDTQSSVPAAIMQRVFKRGDCLSLIALPHTENSNGDALIALIYGYGELEGEPTVTGTSLNKSARVSGVNLDRLDRVIGPYIPDFVMAGGVKKARRYSLNNRGRLAAEAIIKGIVE